MFDDGDYDYCPDFNDYEYLQSLFSNRLEDERELELGQERVLV